MICPITNSECINLMYKKDMLFCAEINDYLLNYSHCSKVNNSSYICCPLCGEKNDIVNFNCKNCRFNL